jgi:hypothetical protein
LLQFLEEFIRYIEQIARPVVCLVLSCLWNVVQNSQPNPYFYPFLQYSPSHGLIEEVLFGRGWFPGNPNPDPTISECLESGITAFMFSVESIKCHPDPPLRSRCQKAKSMVGVGLDGHSRSSADYGCCLRQRSETLILRDADYKRDGVSGFFSFIELHSRTNIEPWHSSLGIVNRCSFQSVE